MKLGIIGLPQSGRSTIFAALSGARGEASKKDLRLSTIKVMDERIDFLSRMYKPKKTTYAQVEYLLPSESQARIGKRDLEPGKDMRRAYSCFEKLSDAMGTAPDAKADFRRLEEEMILNDLVVVDKRIERIELDL